LRKLYKKFDLIIASNARREFIEVELEEILDKVIFPHIGENNKGAGRIGSLETNMRNKMVKSIFLFDIDRSLILYLIFDRFVVIVFLDYSKINKLTR